MAYEDIYKDLTDEEKQRMIKDDIPKSWVIGDANLSEEELEQAEQDLDKIIKNNNQIVKKTCRIEKKSNGLLYFYKIQIKVKESLWNLIKCIKK